MAALLYDEKPADLKLFNKLRRTLLKLVGPTIFGPDNRKALTENRPVTVSLQLSECRVSLPIQRCGDTVALSYQNVTVSLPFIEYDESDVRYFQLLNGCTCDCDCLQLPPKEEVDAYYDRFSNTGVAEWE